MPFSRFNFGIWSVKQPNKFMMAPSRVDLSSDPLWEALANAWSPQEVKVAHPPIPLLQHFSARLGSLCSISVFFARNVWSEYVFSFCSCLQIVWCTSGTDSPPSYSRLSRVIRLPSIAWPGRRKAYHPLYSLQLVMTTLFDYGVPPLVLVRPRVRPLSLCHSTWLRNCTAQKRMVRLFLPRLLHLHPQALTQQELEPMAGRLRLLPACIHGV